MLVDVLRIGLGVLFLVAGLVGRRFQPGNPIGLLFVLAGCSWLIDRVVSDTSFWWLLPQNVWAPLLGHLVVAFPTGRLHTVPRLVVVGAAYLETAVLAAARAWGNRALLDTEFAMTAVVGSGMLVLLVRQWMCSSPAQRRTLSMMVGASLLAVGVVTAWAPAYRAGMQPPYVALVLSLSGIPLAYLVGLLRRRMDRGAVADLVVRLSAGHPRASVRDALATTLHDPELRVGYWLAEQQRYVDADGSPMAPEPSNVLTQVNRGEHRVALLAHDPVLLDNPELVDAACAAVALALDNERLTAELRARLRQLAESRDRVLQASEAERRRIERDLHDGVQQRLLSVAMTLGLAEATAPHQLTSEAKAAVLATIDELRALCHGIHPPVLTERGLHGAVRELTAVTAGVDLTWELTDPLPPQVETTAYYVVAEALANVVKHAHATRTVVAVTGGAGSLLVRIEDDGRGGVDPERGSGLRGLTDRVEANGGTLRVHSSSRGTRVHVELPCA
ncbi:two-component sensor histidine kinase [Lentzea sp. NBRC 105346]|uniref:sensor histidine kinase n=1 Tax=Lentzea sp. NBRC 105346 TaxID=3032205 RepID=UPI0024A44FE3|nr:histidine kinase [Lentzea sp. NBRC 105346]GLZ28862.1 two-component sensor histidine kinase [Lentzea sp. NBRC 105346]